MQSSKPCKSFHEFPSLCLILCIFLFLLKIRSTYGIHSLPVEWHHGMSCITHEDALITNVIWRTLNRHHGLCRQAEKVPLEGIAVTHKWRKTPWQTKLDDFTLTKHHFDHQTQVFTTICLSQKVVIKSLKQFTRSWLADGTHAYFIFN